jgi:hypothetical protein
MLPGSVDAVAMFFLFVAPGVLYQNRQATFAQRARSNGRP